MLTSEKLPKAKTTQVQTYAGDLVTIVDVVENHQTSQHCNRLEEVK
jgi:hypothetical protein